MLALERRQTGRGLIGYAWHPEISLKGSAKPRVHGCSGHKQKENICVHKPSRLHCWSFGLSSGGNIFFFIIISFLGGWGRISRLANLSFMDSRPGNYTRLWLPTRIVRCIRLLIMFCLLLRYKSKGLCFFSWLRTLLFLFFFISLLSFWRRRSPFSCLQRYNYCNEDLLQFCVSFVCLRL